MEQSFSSPIWMTYKQALELGGQVRKGSKGSMVVYANTVKKTETDEATGEELEQNIPFMKGYTVFNVEQVDGLDEDYYALAEPVIDPVERIDHAERFFASLHADIRHGGYRAYYAIGPDYVQIPPFESFKDAESFYSTLGHEACHWTRHTSRLDRSFGRKAWSDAGYAREELVAAVFAKEPFAGPKAVLAYLSRYTHRVAIANRWLISVDDKTVTFTWKDYRAEGQEGQLPCI